MFWGVTLESGKRYSQVVDTSYHLSMAALEPRQGGEPVMVMLEHGKAEFLLCTLDQGNSRQVPLDLNFVEGEEVTFFLNGKGTVHLTGYLTDGLQDDDESSDEEVSLPDEEENDQENELAMGDRSPQKSSKHTKKAKKAKQAKLLQVFNGESEDESDSDFDVDQVEDETEDDDDDAPDDVDEEASEEEEPQPLSLVQRKRPPQKRPADKAPDSASPAAEKRASLVPSTSSEDTVARKKRKKNKKQRSETPTAASDNTQAQPSPQGAAQAQGNKLVTTYLPGGVACTDLRVGSGPLAKPGRIMHVYYTGKLANNKVFDSCTSGKAFSFRLGKQEVIKGWDAGVHGMKVGGRRRLVIPPSQAYGSARMGAIPPNSTLYFDVELKAVS
uniref:FK506-binding protein n=1 Tax=Amblyomma aureolatum TaxID=187763 RepID=A0A1E1XI77_9ACAR